MTAAKMRPWKAFLCSAVWPPRVAEKPSGGRDWSTIFCTASLAAPRSESGAMLAVTCTMRCRYLRSIMTGPLRRSMLAKVSTLTMPLAGVRTNRSPRSATCPRLLSSMRTLM